MRKKADYSIEEWDGRNWYVVRSETTMYLFRDGKMRDWQKAVEHYGISFANDETTFGSKSAASRALNRYLKGGKK